MNKPTNLQKLKDEALKDPKVKEEYDKLKQIEEDIGEALNEFLLGQPTGTIPSTGEVFQPILRDILEEHFPSDIKVEIEVLDEDSRLMGVGVEIPFSKNPKI